MRTKSTEVMGWGLVFIAEGFEAVVQSQEDFEHEIASPWALPILIAPAGDYWMQGPAKRLAVISRLCW